MSDTTGEGASRTAKHTGGHVALLSDEGETLKIIAGRYAKDGQADVEFWLKAHAGSPYRVRRSTREGFDLSRVTAAFVVSIQPDVILQLRGVAQLKGLGFFARLLYGLPKSSIGKRKARRGAIPADVKAAYERAVRNLFPADFADYNSNDERRVEFSPAADRALERLQEAIEPRLVGDLDQMRDWAARFPGAVARIAGLLHVADRGFAGKVSLETYKAAEKIGLCYLGHAQAVFYRLGQDPRIEGARHVLSKLSAGEEISKRDVFEKVKGHHLTQTVEQLDAALKVLADHGWVSEVPQEREGPGRKPSPLLEVNPLTPESGSQNSHNSSSADAKADKTVDDEEMPKSPKGDNGVLKRADKAFGILLEGMKRRGAARLIPESWEYDALPHMSKKVFSEAKAEIERRGWATYSIGDRYEDSRYYLSDDHICSKWVGASDIDDVSRCPECGMSADLAYKRKYVA
jgi:hypothetical protein